MGKLIGPGADPRLALQSTVRLFRVGKETILHRSGERLTIEDPLGIVFDVLQKLDGRQPLSTIRLREDQGSPASVDPVVRDIVEQLLPLGILEDSDLLERSADLLDDYAVSRWNRNFDFFASLIGPETSKYAVQKKISQTRVLLLGIGGVGTHSLLDLVSLGFLDILAVDFDRIELSNLNRQILYSESDVGKKKIAAASDAIGRYLDPARHSIRFSDVYIDGAAGLLPLLDGRDIVIGCVDRPQNVMAWINEACVRARVPFVSGGVDTTRTCTYTVIPGETGCVECWRLHNAATSSTEHDLFEQEMDRDVLALAPRPAVVNLVSVQVGFLLSEVLKIVAGLGEPSATNKLVQFDFRTMRTSVPETWSMRPDCPVCGEPAR